MTQIFYEIIDYNVANSILKIREKHVDETQDNVVENIYEIEITFGVDTTITRTLV